MTKQRAIDITVVQQCLTAREWTQRQLADELGVNSDTVSAWMTMKSNPSWKNIINLSKVLELPVEDILLLNPNQIHNMRATIFATVMDIADKIIDSTATSTRSKEQHGNNNYLSQENCDRLDKLSKIMERHFKPISLEQPEPIKQENENENQMPNIPDIPQEEAIANLLGKNT